MKFARYPAFARFMLDFTVLDVFAFPYQVLIGVTPQPLGTRPWKFTRVVVIQAKRISRDYIDVSIYKSSASGSFSGDYRYIPKVRDPPTYTPHMTMLSRKFNDLASAPQRQWERAPKRLFHSLSRTDMKRTTEGEKERTSTECSGREHGSARVAQLHVAQGSRNKTGIPSFGTNRGRSREDSFQA